MRITQATLQNFRSFEGITIALEPLSIIRGANHQGKSSIAQAINLALAKRSDGTDPRGSGANDKIRRGTDKAVIDLTIDGRAGLVGLKATYSKQPRAQSIKAEPNVQQAFAKFLDLNSERLSCCLDSEYFVAQKPEIQKAILAGLVLPTSYTFDPVVVAMAEKRLGAFAWDKSPVALIDQVYDAAYKARTSAKAALGAIYVPATPMPPKHDAATVQAKLQDLRTKAAKEAKKKPAESKEIPKLEQKLEMYRVDMKEHTEQLATDTANLLGIRAQLLENAVVLKHKKIAAGRATFDALEAQIEETVREIEAQREAQGIYEDLLSDPCCPTCTQAITPEFIATKVAFHKTEENKAVELQMDLMKQQKDLGDLAGAEKALATNDELLKRKEQVSGEVSQGSASCAELSVEIQAMEAQLEDLRKAAAVPADTAELDKLNAEIAEWEQALTPAIQYASTLTQIDSATQLKVTKAEEVNDLETLCRVFGKDGIKATLIQENIDGFQLGVNKTLAHWGYHAELNIEPYSFEVVNTQTFVLPLKELSGSEKLMFGVALQCAIAVHSKIKMVLIDKADTFINGERGKLFSCVKRMVDAGELDQAIVMVADDRTEAPKQDGVGFYRVAGGSIEKLGIANHEAQP